MEHYHWNTVVCTGGILLLIPRFCHPLAIEPPVMGGLTIPAEYWWGMTQVEEGEDVEAAPESLIDRVVQASQIRLSVLPSFKWMQPTRLNYTDFGRRPVKKHQAVPGGVLFFRFDGGCGCVALSDKRPLKKGEVA
jgi:hypothetical protein